MVLGVLFPKIGGCFVGVLVLSAGRRSRTGKGETRPPSYYVTDGGQVYTLLAFSVPPKYSAL